ncbi:uncharacterized protein [Zea mays]|uniref:Uncharacterized protein n=2 Tax=Zea mays TaxID=4577 RepID=K7UJ36_MAIZE|nr:uncharacterized protein LOC103641743 [Zea mays]AQK44161.1 hypothetical protein ZEAMMB73_Zm00001d025645 [Zea mays]|eukprot:XP_008663297.1 uncharacterized protein LOC103641743 [Zea mays]
MSCIRRTSAIMSSLAVSILLIVSLLTLHLPIACGRRHVVVLNPSDNGMMNSRGKKVSSTVGAAAAAATTRTVKMRAAVKHGYAVAEVYEMLRRDYASKARRRRPINNGATPLQVNKKP